MVIHENCSIKKLNTFGVDVSARYLAELDSAVEFKELLSTKLFANMPRVILGGGSNVLFLANFTGIVIRNNIRGVEIISETADHVIVKAGAGMNWHELVLWSIEKGYGGIENLSLIPGSVGAGPIQNIGAYGVEIKDVFRELEALKIEGLEIVKFDGEQCKFNYRDSFFKNEGKGRYIITSVSLKLSKKPDFNTKYGAIDEELKRMGIAVISLKAVSDAVCNIRRSKLPDPVILGNAGSFFKNPVVELNVYEKLLSAHPDLVSYSHSKKQRKIAAGWLIEQSGLKGKREGNAGVHEKQALVIVNHGGATGQQIFKLSEMIMHAVKEKFGIDLEREVNII